MGMPYGSLPRKTVPREEQDTAMDYSVLFEFGVRIFHYWILCKSEIAIVLFGLYLFSFFHRVIASTLFYFMVTTIINEVLDSSSSGYLFHIFWLVLGYLATV